MVGVFVAFIRVVYGRMIYMSLPSFDATVNKTRIIEFPFNRIVNVHNNFFFFFLFVL